MFYRIIDGWKYQLSETEVFDTGIKIPAEIQTQYIRMYEDGRLAMKVGYAWDGMSGPAWDTKNTMRAGLAHDGLYQLTRMGLFPLARREEADAYLRLLCRQDGVSAVRAQYIYLAVRSFGWTAIKKNKRDVEEIQIAP